MTTQARALPMATLIGLARAAPDDAAAADLWRALGLAAGRDLEPAGGDGSRRPQPTRTTMTEQNAAAARGLPPALVPSVRANGT